MNVCYGLYGGLSKKQQEEIHEAALKVIDTVGFAVSTPEISNDELFKIVCQRKGVRIRNGRLCFSTELVEELLESQRREAPNTNVAPGDFTIQSIGHAFNVFDYSIGMARPCTIKDCIRFIRLANSYYDEGVHCSSPGFPSDVPVEMQSVAAYKLGCEYSRSNASSTANSPEVAEAIHEMSIVMGHGVASYHVGVHPVSPLRLEGTEFDIAIRMWKKLGNKLSVSCGPMPMMGISSPIYFPSSMAQTIAEAVGSFVLFKLLTGKASFWLNFYAFDMKHGSFAYGGPEDLIIALIRRQMNDYYGLAQNFGDKALITMAHAVDTQAAGEKAAKTIVAALAGTSYLATAGSLSLDESFSLEQLAIDMEIVRWTRHVVKGFEYDASMLDISLFKEGVDAGDFMMSDSTLIDYKKTYWIPELFDHKMLAQWKTHDGKILISRAHEIAEARIATEEYRLDEAKQRELERIYNAFSMQICK